jgi:hypothetical protein
MRYTARLTLFLYLAVTVSADDLVITEKSFGCLLDLPKVRNTRIQNPDPQKLKEAIQIFKDSVPDKEYPTGTILQLIPTEAMVKHERAAFPNTNGWEFFALKVSADGTAILDRGDKAQYVVEEALSGLPLACCEIRFRMRKGAWLCAHSCHRSTDLGNAVC